MIKDKNINFRKVLKQAYKHAQRTHDKEELSKQNDGWFNGCEFKKLVNDYLKPYGFQCDDVLSIINILTKTDVGCHKSTVANSSSLINLGASLFLKCEYLLLDDIDKHLKIKWGLTTGTFESLPTNFTRFEFSKRTKRVFSLDVRNHIVKDINFKLQEIDSKILNLQNYQKHLVKIKNTIIEHSSIIMLNDSI